MKNWTAKKEEALIANVMVFLTSGAITGCLIMAIYTYLTIPR